VVTKFQLSSRYKKVVQRRLSSDGVDDVVDLHQAADGLGGQGDGGGRDEQRLDDVLLQDVGDHALANVDAGIHLTLTKLFLNKFQTFSPNKNENIYCQVKIIQCFSCTMLTV
jgi:hypothetical protein